MKNVQIEIEFSLDPIGNSLISTHASVLAARPDRWERERRLAGGGRCEHCKSFGAFAAAPSDTSFSKRFCASIIRSRWHRRRNYELVLNTPSAISGPRGNKNFSSPFPLPTVCCNACREYLFRGHCKASGSPHARPWPRRLFTRSPLYSFCRDLSRDI